MIGKSLSYYYQADDGLTLFSYLAGRINDDDGWEFLKSEAVVGVGEESLESVENTLAKNLTTFINEHAVPFWQDKDIPPNENTFGHPV